MTGPRILKAGLVVLAPGGGAVQRTVTLQYNPDSLARSFQVQGAGGDGGGERAQPFRLKGPAVETLRLEAEVDATDHLAQPDQHPATVAHGIAPQLALLEALVHPTVADIQAHDALAAQGVLEIVPPEAPLVLFAWGAGRVVPVRVAELSITEEAFDGALNPIRARVSLALRVLSGDDLGSAHKGAQLFLEHLRRREGLAGKAAPGTPGQLGVSGL